MCKCDFSNGMEVKIGNVEMSAGVFQVEEVYTNATVVVERCKKCGEFLVSWIRTPQTEEVPEDEWDDVLRP